MNRRHRTRLVGERTSALALPLTARWTEAQVIRPIEVPQILAVIHMVVRSGMEHASLLVMIPQRVIAVATRVRRSHQVGTRLMVLVVIPRDLIAMAMVGANFLGRDRQHRARETTNRKQDLHASHGNTTGSNENRKGRTAPRNRTPAQQIHRRGDRFGDTGSRLAPSTCGYQRPAVAVGPVVAIERREIPPARWQADGRRTTPHAGSGKMTEWSGWSDWRKAPRYPSCSDRLPGRVVGTSCPDGGGRTGAAGRGRQDGGRQQKPSTSNVKGQETDEFSRHSQQQPARPARV